jgi:hypothetical protein
MLTFAGVSASAPPFVTSGIALAMPPVPVETGVPVAVRRNHVSTVKFVTPRALAAPKVTRWLEPDANCSAVPALADGVADASVEAGERWLAWSTATTT